MTTQRNPRSHRHTKANERRTLLRVEQYYGKVALLNTWEAQPDEVQIAEHDYLLRLRKTVRQVKSYLVHRADADAQF